MARKSKATPATVPNLHFVMIVAALIVVVMSAVAYFFAPPEKSDYFQIIGFSALTFLFGKFSNGFGQRFQPTPPVVSAIPVPPDESEEDSE